MTHKTWQRKQCNPPHCNTPPTFSPLNFVYMRNRQMVEMGGPISQALVDTVSGIDKLSGISYQGTIRGNWRQGNTKFGCASMLDILSWYHKEGIGYLVKEMERFVYGVWFGCFVMVPYWESAVSLKLCCETRRRILKTHRWRSYVAKLSWLRVFLGK